MQSECLFKDLAERAKDSLKTIYVDDCSKMRNKLKDIFGNDVVIKLDLFHTVQRIPKTLPKSTNAFFSVSKTCDLFFILKVIVKRNGFPVLLHPVLFIKILSPLLKNGKM